MNDNIQVSVVVTAYNRRMFIKNAINSILRQTLPRVNYEVIVVKNYEDKDLDSFLLNNGCILEKSNDNDTFGACLVKGILRSRGAIICFLDDDDEFIYTKLEKVFDEFSENRLQFFHNGMIPINDEGYKLEKHWIWKMAPETDILVSNPLEYLDYKKLFRIGADFGASSICISKELAYKLVPNLGRLTSASDNFMFYMACTDVHPIKISSERLTKYRIHAFNSSKPMSNSFPDYLKRYKKNASEAYNSYGVISSLVDGYKVSKFATYRYASYKFGFYVSMNRKNGFAAFKDLINFIKCDFYLRIPRAILFGICYVPLRFSNKARRIFLYVLWKLTSLK